MVTTPGEEIQNGFCAPAWEFSEALKQNHERPRRTQIFLRTTSRRIWDSEEDLIWHALSYLVRASGVNGSRFKRMLKWMNIVRRNSFIPTKFRLYIQRWNVGWMKCWIDLDRERRDFILDMPILRVLRVLRKSIFNNLEHWQLYLVLYFKYHKCHKQSVSSIVISLS